VRERESRQGDWKDRLRETLERKREQAERIRESIQRDDENLERWRGTLEGLRPGPRAAEIQAGLEEKMTSVGERRASKQGRLEELEAAIREIEAKL
jgi:chromosome segregation ATPase